eukprot:scaffold156026_cov22-Tisochrysis_lutea.AAC.1
MAHFQQGTFNCALSIAHFQQGNAVGTRHFQLCTFNHALLHRLISTIGVDRGRQVRWQTCAQVDMRKDRANMPYHRVQTHV